MHSWIRRMVAAVGVGCTLIVMVPGVSWAALPSAAGIQRTADGLDGYRLGHLPAGLGTSVSDFAYEWGGVGFASRVWERGPDEHGAYSVDLMVSVLRGERLRTGAGLYDFMNRYLEEDPAAWQVIPLRVHGRPGWIGVDRIFFLTGPGVAISILLDTDRFAWTELLRIGYGICPAQR